MADTNRRLASDRMKARNPMRHDASRAKMRATLKRVGLPPVLRGGNGKPVPSPQQRLATALGWRTEHVIATGLRGKTPEKYPTNYKIDIANPVLKIAIEVDGGSHAALSRRTIDAKKDAFLQSRGWVVLRFTNDEVETDLVGCLGRVVLTMGAGCAR